MVVEGCNFRVCKGLMQRSSVRWISVSVPLPEIVFRLMPTTEI